MKQHRISYYGFIGLMLMAITSCSKVDLEQEATSAGVDDTFTRADLVEYTIDVKTAGTLDSLVEAGDYLDAQKLIVTGNIGYYDVKYVDENMPTVEVLDLSGATYNNSVGYAGFNRISSSTSIKEISLPKGVKEIDTYCFQCCKSLTSVTIQEGVTSIGYDAFGSCSSLISITLPESVTSIGDYAFSQCSSLTNITLPKGVTSIGEETFGSCSSLTSINIPEGVTSIGYGAFYKCSSLTSIDIPEGVTSIGSYAFYKCSSLTSLTLPKSVTSIGNYAFSGCSSLRKLICNSLLDDIDDLNTSDNLYCWLIINRSDGNIPMYGPNWKNVVINGVAENVTLPYHKEIDFTIPEEVNSIKKISYTMIFEENTLYGLFGIWKTIALPFTPTSITHAEKGILAPFDSEVEGATNFWLRELTTDGFKDVTQIEANHPYIIAMPCSVQYVDRYNISGEVTFSAENLTAEDFNNCTPLSAVGTDYTMYASYSYIDKIEGVYALTNSYPFRFVNNDSSVYPYEAYLKANTATLRSVISLSQGRAATRAGVGEKREPQKDDM